MSNDESKSGIWVAVVGLVGLILAAVITGYCGLGAEVIGAIVTRGLTPRTPTPDAAATATSLAFEWEPRLESSYLAISLTSDWNPKVDDAPLFAEAHQLADVPPEAVGLLAGSNDAHFVWQMATNVNSNPQSCGRAIAFRGPILSFLGPTFSVRQAQIDPLVSEPMNALRSLFPNATVANISTHEDYVVAELEGSLDSQTSLELPLLLFFYTKPIQTSRALCGGQTLAIPIAAFRMPPSTRVPAPDYFLAKISLESVTTIWALRATLGPGIEETREYMVLSRRDFYPVELPG